MDAVLTVAYAEIAAIGNALFALGQKQSSGSGNGLLFVALSAFVAFALAVVCAPLVGPFGAGTLIRDQWRSLLLSGVGLFLTYVGFHLLYSRFGTSPYVVYAALAIITTTVGVGFLVPARARQSPPRRRGAAGGGRDRRVLDRPVEDLSAGRAAPRRQCSRTGTTSAASCTSSPRPYA